MQGIRHTAIVHRLVAKTFIPNPENFPIVNHKNGIRDDNRICNLEWCTASYNMLHSLRELGRKPKDNTGIKNPKAILSEEDVLEIRRLHSEEGKTTTYLASIYNMKKPAIWKILNNYTWKHLGHITYSNPVRCTSIYKYVLYLEVRNRWVANIYEKDRRKYLGRHKTEIEAAEAVKKYLGLTTYLLN